MSGAAHRPRDLEVLADLVCAYDQCAKIGWQRKLNGEGFWDGVSPLDCGGSDGSDHSYRLTKLVKIGLAEHRKGSEWGRSSTRFRGAKKYRPTDAGRATLAAYQATKP